MHYKVFYSFERSGESVSSVSAVEMSAKAICEQLLGRLKTDDDYIGIVDAADNTLQILRESADRFWVEIPLDAAKASFGCYKNRDELGELIRELPQTIDQTSIPGLTYKPW